MLRGIASARTASAASQAGMSRSVSDRDSARAQRRQRALMFRPTALAALELSGNPVHARALRSSHPATVRNFTLEYASRHATSLASVMRAIVTGMWMLA
jgi:hypothetical protein